MYFDLRYFEPWHSHEPTDAHMRVRDEIKKTVCFLCVKTERGDYKYGGTAFLIHFAETASMDHMWVYLVTAKHSVRRALKKYGNLYARFNFKDGSARFVELENRWVFPDSEASDVAILRIDPGENVDYVATPVTPVHMTLGTDDALRRYAIGIGNEVLIVGLFTQRHGTQRNIPIIRSGMIAAMPEEPLQDPDSNLDYNAYLIETRSISGLSGSPVYALAEVNAALGLREDVPYSSIPRMQCVMIMIGLIRGHWDLSTKNSSIDFANDADGRLNAGIAIVTPIQEVLDLLMKDKSLVTQRKEDRERAKGKEAPTLDHGFEGEDFTKEDFENALRKTSRKLDDPPKQ